MVSASGSARTTKRRGAAPTYSKGKHVTSVIAGPRTLEQWTGYTGALAHRFTAADEALIDRLVPTGHPSTPGYSDPQYPIRGRPTFTA